MVIPGDLRLCRSMCLAFRRCLFSLSSPAGGEGRGEEAHRQVSLGLPPPPPSPPSSLAGGGRNWANTLNPYPPLGAGAGSGHLLCDAALLPSAASTPN